MVACSHSDSPKEDTLSLASKYELKTIKKTFGNCDSAICHELSIVYPVFEVENLNNKVAEILAQLRLGENIQSGKTEDEVVRSILTEVESLFSEMQHIYDESYFGESYPKLYADLSVSVQWEQAGLISFYSNIDEFSGGAHPNSLTILKTLDTQNNLNELTWADILDTRQLPKFMELVKEIFYKTRFLDPGESLEEQGFWFQDNIIKLNDNFILNKEGLIIYYNAYEIAPYVMGSTKLILTWDKIKPYLQNKIKERIGLN